MMIVLLVSILFIGFVGCMTIAFHDEMGKLFKRSNIIDGLLAKAAAKKRAAEVKTKPRNVFADIRKQANRDDGYKKLLDLLDELDV